MSISRVMVAINPQIAEAPKLASEITQELTSRGLESHQGPISGDTLKDELYEGEYGLVVALGGDGTMLRAGQLCAPCEVPILGINLGHVGFLTEVGRDGWRGALDSALRGDCWIEKRMMLRVTHERAGELLATWNVLNEVFVGRGDMVRPVHLEAAADGNLLSSYIADGLIAATATGSTAYALAAGGPILPPELRNILLLPVAPHFSLERPIVLHEGTSVRIRLLSQRDAILSVDGQASMFIEAGDEVTACVGDHEVGFVRTQDSGYFYRNITSYLNSQQSEGRK